MRRRSTAFVTALGGVLPVDIFLENEKARNRAQEGDLVSIFRHSTTCTLWVLYYTALADYFSHVYIPTFRHTEVSYDRAEFASNAAASTIYHNHGRHCFVI